MNTSNNQSISTCPSSSSSLPSWDVFLSFYGKDTRRNFVANLYFVLDQAGISTFRDDPALEKGQEISSGLLNAIKDTNMFVVVVSKNYARSSWCLNELVEILASKKSKNHVIPVFYYVDPSDLRHQKGSFGEALESHKKHYSVDVIGKWKSALTEIADLSGYHLKKDANENESDTVQEIVERVASQAPAKILDLEEEYLVGMDRVVEEIYQKLWMESSNVRAIGICGMGGIGKTTASKAFYNKYSHIFDISCFVENVNQYIQENNPLFSLLQQLLGDLLRRKNYEVSNVESGIRQLQHILNRKKALIILDGLDQSSNLEWLARLCKMLSSGSRIVITTRDVNVLNQLEADISEVDIYMVKKLELMDSLKLFSSYAFREPMPPESFRELTVKFVTYAEGLPLALKVLGAFLRGRTEMAFWEDKYKEVQDILEDKICAILRLSYDGLADDRKKAIFLDIVFFFIGKDKDEAVHIFRSCNFFPHVGITILVDKCLLTIDQNKKFQMHNLIQDMGRAVIREESSYGNSRYVHLCEENEWQALQNLEGANKIEVLVLDLNRWTKKHISTKIFERLPKLRLLEVIGAHDIRGNYENSFHELRCIRWYHCPWRCLPSTFRPQKLVSLDMPFNQYEMLWQTSKLLLSLKIINMSYSKKLKRCPDFSDFVMVEKLCFRGCESLQKLHPSIGQLKYLEDLDMGECSSLKELPETIGQLCKLVRFDLPNCVNLKRLPQHIKQLGNLSSLNLRHCRNLIQLPEQLGDMKGLKMIDASYTAIEQLPDSIGHLKQLVSLKLTRCMKLRKLPEQFGNMEGLKEFDAHSSGIEELPDSTGQLINLAYLTLFGCHNLASLPDSLQELKLLQLLYIFNCSKLERLPEQLGKMQSLELISASETAIQELPDSIILLSRLESLDLSDCKKLKYVPNDIWNLKSLESLHLPTENMFISNLPENHTNNIEHLSLRCDIRSWLPTLQNSSFTSLHLCDEGKNLSSTKWCLSLSKHSNLEELTLDNWGSSFLELPLYLRDLHLYHNATVEQLPDLSNLEHLKSLYIADCISLQSLPPLPLNLERLFVQRCSSLKDVPDLAILKKLYILRIHHCSSLKSIDLKQSSLQVQVQPRKYSYSPSSSFSAQLPNRKIAEWFDYKNKGSRVSLNIPSSSVLGDDFLGIALWVVFKVKDPRSYGYIRAVITNKTEHIKNNYDIDLGADRVGDEVQSMVQCISRHEISVKSGDKIKVSFQKSVYRYDSYAGEKIPGGELKVENCGAHVILKDTSSTP